MSRKNRRRRGICLALAMVLLWAFLAVPETPVSYEVQAATSLEELKERQEELKKQAEANQAKIDQLKQDTAKQQEYKATLDAQIQNLGDQINGLNSQIAVMDGQIQEKNQEIAEKQASINSNIETLKQRLCAMYMLGEASNLQLILSSENVMDMAEKTELIRMISEHDTNLVQQLSTELESIAQQRQEIQQNREAVAAAKAEMDEKQNQLAALQQEAERVLRNVESLQGEAAEEQKELEKKQQEAEAAIDKWFDEQAAQNGGGSSGGSTGGGSGGSGVVSKGQFRWPVPGYTDHTDYFGSRGGTHKGVDISWAGIFGKPIVAADAGTVVFARFGMPGSGYGGYGNVVVINHGNGYMTFYAHCNSLNVSEGQTVSRGQTIATVGSTGQSTGPHLHYEIRYNGVAKDPDLWYDF